jgi:hypothetical protein
MTPTNDIKHIDLSIGQSNDKRFLFNSKDQDGTALDLAAFSEITFVICRNVNSAILLTKTLTGDGISTSAGGVFYFDISDTESAALPAGVLFCEVQMIASETGDKQTVAQGHFRNINTRIGE